MWDIPEEFGVNAEEIDNLRRKKIPIKGEAIPAEARIEKYRSKEHNPNVIPKAKTLHNFHPNEVIPKRIFQPSREPAVVLPERRFVFLDELPRQWDNELYIND